MKNLIAAFIFLVSPPNKEVIGFRELLHKSFYDQKLAEQYYLRTKHINEKSLPVMRGYKAMAEFVMIRHTFNPFSKLSHFNQGRRELDAALLSEPGNVELVFLRFATQVNAPSFLGYNANIKDDKKILFDYATSQQPNEDPDLKNKIVTFLLKSKHVSGVEKKALKQLNKS